MWKKIWDELRGIDPKRIVTSVLLLAVVGIVGFFHNFLNVWAFLGVVYLIALYEATGLYFERFNGIVFASGIIVWMGAYWMQYSVSYSLWLLFSVMVIGASFQAYTKKGNDKMIMPLIYPTLPFLSLLALYQNLGLGGLILLLLIVSIGDTFAFAGGKTFGKNLFCPTSPNKTTEGVLIGVCAASLAGTVFACVWWTEVKLVEALLVALITSMAAIFGDLYESYLKRMAGLKDSGKLLPGHGGVLDRVDGYLFAVIVLYPLLMWLTQK